jgi:hypothetical protein
VYAQRYRRAFTGNLQVKSDVDGARRRIQSESKRQVGRIAENCDRIGVFLLSERQQFYQLCMPVVSRRMSFAHIRRINSALMHKPKYFLHRRAVGDPLPT